MGWADYYKQKDQDAKKQQEKVKALNSLAQGSEALKRRHTADNKEPLPVKATKQTSANKGWTAPTLGKDEFIKHTDARNPAVATTDWSKRNPTLHRAIATPSYVMKEVGEMFPSKVSAWFARGSETGGEMATMVDKPDKVSTGSKLGDFSADIVGSMAGIIANPGSGGGRVGTSVGGGILRGAEDLTQMGMKKLTPKVPGIAQSMVREGAGSLAYEGARALANERDFSAREAATAFLGDALFAGALGGVGKGLGKSLDIKTGKVKMDDDISYDSLFDEVIRRNRPETAPAQPDTDLLGSMQSKYQGMKMPPTQAEKQLAPNPLLTQMRNTMEGKSNTPVAPLPRAEAISRSIDPESVAYDKYPLPDVSPETLAAKALVKQAKTEQLMLPGGAAKALPEPYTPNWEYGTGYPTPGSLHVDPYGVVRNEPGMPLALPEGRLSPQQRMSQLIDQEVDILRKEGGQGVLPGGLKYNNEGEVIGRFGRQSQNPPWYRELYAQNGGKQPTKAQLQELAERNLREGIDSNPEYRGNPEMEALKADMAERQRSLVAAGSKDNVRHNVDVSPFDSGRQTDFAESVKPFGKYGKLITDADGNYALVGKNGQAIKLRVTTEPGQYSSWNKSDPTITLRQTDTGEFEFDHELMHGMRDLGLITDAEWRKLQGLALARIDIEAVFNEYKAAGINLDRDGLQHEAVARAAQYWRKNGIPGEAQGIMQKIMQFLHDLGRNIGVSKTRAEDVARDVMSGKPLGRILPEGTKGAERFNVPESNQTIIITGNEFGEGLSQNEIRNKAYDYARKNHQGKEITNTDTGVVIRIPGSGIKHVNAFSGDIRKSQLLYVLPEILEKSKYVGSEKPYKNNVNIRAIHRFQTSAQVGIDNVKINTVVRETNEGKLFYDYRLSNIEKESAGSPGSMDSLRNPQPSGATNSFNNSIASNKTNLKREGDNTNDLRAKPLPSQEYGSAKTSLNQIAATFKDKNYLPGKTNLDIGGGKHNTGSEFLAERGTENLVYDPFNREAYHNSAILDRLQDGEKTDTVTVNNVLNVIKEPEIRSNVIKQAAKSLFSGQKAYFKIYEGNRSGVGKETPKGWQNNMKAAQYMEEISRHFDDVQRKGSLIIAENPKKNPGEAFWMVDDTGKGSRRFSVPADWDHTTTKTGGPQSSTRQKANRAYAAVIDDLYQVQQVDNITKGLSADEKAYVLAQNAKQAGGTAKHIVTKALVDPNGNAVGESLKDITKGIPAGKTKDFENYLIYRHAPSWLDQGHQVFPENEGITTNISRQRAAVYEAQNPDFKALGDRIIDWHKQLSKTWLVDTGLISQQQFDAMNRLYPDYIPFQRELSDAESLGGFNRQKGQPVKRAKGSERKIISPIESMIEHADRYVKQARKNSVLQAIDNQITQDPQGLAGFIERIGADEVYDKPNVVTARINGENVRYKVNDPDLFKAMEGLSPKGDEGVIKAARQLTRMMKILTTGSNPIFATRNIARDLPMAYIASDTLTNIPGAREVQFAWGILDSLASVVTGGKYDPAGTYKTFRALGGGTHSSAMAADRNLLAESKASILKGDSLLKNPFKTAGKGVKAAGRGIEMFTNAFETAPRYAEYKRTIQQEGDTPAARQQGLFNAQDITVNFSRHGSMARTPDAFVPYLNAALQGIDKVGRIYQKDPLLATMRSLVAVTVPTVGLYLMNRDDPAYNRLSRWTKDNYYCIKMASGKFLKIAKPRETGVVFGSLVERALQKWDNDDPQAFKGFSEAWMHSFAPPYRTIAAPLTDAATNTSFSGSPIVPSYMQKLEPGLQFDENTSWPAKKLGETLNVSPKKLDYLTRSYTGVLGELGIPAASGGRGENALQRVGNTLSRAFTADPLYSNNTLNDFYERKDQLDTAYYTYQQTKQKGENFNAAERKRYTKAATQIGKLSKQIRAVNANTELSYEEKDQQVRALKQRQLDIAGKLQ